MSDDHELFAEVLRALRGWAEDIERVATECPCTAAQKLRAYADRFEAAFKREMGDVLDMARHALDCLWKMSQLRSPVAKRVYKQLTDGLGTADSGKEADGANI